MKNNHFSSGFSPEELKRYSRHFSLPEVGPMGQTKLKKAKVLCIGAGGLGAPLLLYLTAAGIGTIGIIDHDTVDLSNLQRQILFNTASVGKSKVDVAKSHLLALNPNVDIQVHRTAINQENILEILQAYDIVVDGSDNFATRYLVNDACCYLKKPLVFASIFQFEGQCSVFNLLDGPCYRCLYPEPPPQGLIPNCAEGGVLGILPGLMGCIQASEVLKLALNLGEHLSGRLLTVDVLGMNFKEYPISKNAHCLCQQGLSFEKFPRYDSARCGASQQAEEISVKNLQSMIKNQETFTLLDVREPHEYDICHLDAQLIPLRMLPQYLPTLDKAKNYIVYCHVGERSRYAANLMREQGFQSVKNLTGGIRAWSKEIDPSMPDY